MSLEVIKTIGGEDAVKFTVEGVEYVLTPEELTEVGFSNYPKELKLDDKELAFDHYRILRRMYSKLAREAYKKGHLHHLAKYSSEAWVQMNQEYIAEHGAIPQQKGKTYVKSEDQGAGEHNESQGSEAP